MKMNAETKRKLREMGCDRIIEPLESQDEKVCMGLGFEERMQIAVDEAHSAWLTAEVTKLTSKAKLKYKDADVRSIDFDERRNLDRVMFAELATCGFAERGEHVVLQGFTGSGKTYASNAFAKECCKHRLSTYYIRMPKLEEDWKAACRKPGSEQRLINKLVKYQVLVLDEWLLDRVDKDFRSFILEVMEERCDNKSTIFCTQYQKQDWHSRLGGGVQADAVMDRIIHNAHWIETGDFNMRAKLSKINNKE